MSCCSFSPSLTTALCTFFLSFSIKPQLSTPFFTRLSIVLSCITTTMPNKKTQALQPLQQHGAGAPPHQEHLPCPRCESNNTKFCYYNNYNFSQPRYFCKACRRYWTQGGALRNIPIGGGTRRNSSKRIRTNSASNTTTSFTQTTLSVPQMCNLPAGSFTSLLNSQVPEIMGLGFDNFGLGIGSGVWPSLMNLSDCAGIGNNSMWQLGGNNCITWSETPRKCLK